MVCIYHSKDLDGFTSGAIVLSKYPNVKLIGWDYGMEIPYDQILEGEEIIMADISFEMEEMYKLAKRSKWRLTWIDHHISAINKYNKFIGMGESFCMAFLDTKIAACEGVWKYIYPEIPIPKAVLLLGEYDSWRDADKHHWENEVMPFQFGMRISCNSPETFDQLFFCSDSNKRRNLTAPIISIGKGILKYQTQLNQSLCKKAAFEAEFEGHVAICVNGGGFNSDVFKSVYDESKHDIMIPFQFNGKSWNVSLYTTKEIDCSLIAQKFNGGGHKKASGFEIDDVFKIWRLSL